MDLTLGVITGRQQTKMRGLSGARREDTFYADLSEWRGDIMYFAHDKTIFARPT